MNVREQWIAFVTILVKEIRRFTRIWPQTLLPPAITIALYFVIFGTLIGPRIGRMAGFSYIEFVVPGLIMMSLLQNSFSNSSSSLIQAKIMGNIVFLLLTPLSYLQLFFAFLIAAIVRGMFVGVCIYLIAMFYVDLPVEHPWFVFIFAFCGGGLMGAFGMIAGIWATRFDQMAAFGNFVIMPLSMLSGVFYSIHSLPQVWQNISHFNPFFYMIDGFRYGFFGQSDTSPYLSLLIVVSFFIILSFITIRMLKSGYKLRN